MKYKEFIKRLLNAMNALKGRDSFKIHGRMDFTMRHKDGSVSVFAKDNLIVDVGFDFITDVMGNPTQPSEMSHIEVGTGTTAADAADTALETALLRKAATYFHTASTKVFTMTATFLAGEATGALTEAGVFNNAVGGIMLDRVVFPVKNKAAPDELTVKFTFTLS